jgi:acyl dehydratase
MPIDESLVGRTSEPVIRSWTSKDALLYAVAVGAGQADPQQELAFTTENSHGQRQRVLPTFACVAFGGGSVFPDDIDFRALLHAEQSFSLTGELATNGEVQSTSKIVSVYDKGSAAVLSTESTSVDSEGRVVATTTSSVFLRGYGGFGGSRGPAPTWERPAGKPDFIVTYQTRPEQALLYRLTGDRNPLHSDPAFAAQAGFPRPILHGMCTYGFTGRALLHTVANSEPGRLRHMSGRFSKPIFPGDSVTVSIWQDGSEVRFVAADALGNAVIDHGTAVLS